MRRFACAAAAALSITVNVAPAQSAERPPVPGAPRPFRVPPHRTFTMKNGMQVTLIHYGLVPKTVVSLVLGTGAIDEPPFGPGLASLTADVLLQGTVARSAQGVSREAADLGGHLDVSTGAVATSIGGEALSEYTARFVSLLSDVVRHPALDPAGFERVRQNAVRNLAITLQNASDQARQQWRSMVFPDHPFGHPYSNEKTLLALQLGHVRNFYDDNYGAARAHLYISGLFDDQLIERAARDAFSDWKTGLAAAPRPANPVARRQLSLIDRPGAPQSTIWIGLPVIDPASADFVKFEVADALLGGSFGSRITSNIREDKGYTYSPYSTIWRRKGATYWVEVADVTTKDTGASLKEILSEIERLRGDAPPVEELEGIKRNVVGLFTIQNSSRDGMVAQMQYLAEHGLGEKFLTSYVGSVLSVSPQDVQGMARAHLDPSRMTITVVGDRAVVEPQLAPFRPIVP